MQFSDEILMAYADDEVDADLRRQIEAAMALDPSIAERVAKHRSLRADLGVAFDGVLDEPIPDRLLEAAASSPAKPASVTDLKAARMAKERAAHPRRWSWVEWTSIAASLIIGILAGRTALHPSRSDLFATSADGIVARGELSAALTDQIGGDAKDAKVRIGLTFRVTSGDYCRTFVTASAAGFACREPNEWKVRALSEGGSDVNGGDYRMAGTELPPAILAAVEQSMAGEALDREQEQAARARDWKK
ncbi:anti-sigma factor [Steroidobacter agaridevorans]|uniref:Anti-sigma factor n=1 Tax=Steroidobacter agaridevorans TaxID=2695856 RepID=A0A829Y562_9GAMM|nr:anti-sigma factor [Steroidobacter agaridevorans]GFE78108.1 anti-sigma factor [Steroidobacter agaridevorans]GFE91167.1 anti-sigma factor [Steroidobacter agaridevorans]